LSPQKPHDENDHSHENGHGQDESKEESQIRGEEAVGDFWWRGLLIGALSAVEDNGIEPR